MTKILIKNEQGFTLLEVMTSMFIMGFALLLLLNLGMVAVDGNSWASGTTSAVQLLQQKLEELRNENDPVGGVDTVVAVNGTGDIVRFWRVTGTSVPNLRKVEMSAKWLSSNSKEHIPSISTYILVAP